MYRCAQVSTDRLQMVPFMPRGYITDISLHVLKPFDHREAENPVLEILIRNNMMEATLKEGNLCLISRLRSQQRIEPEVPLVLKIVR